MGVITNLLNDADWEICAVGRSSENEEVHQSRKISAQPY